MHDFALAAAELLPESIKTRFCLPPGEMAKVEEIRLRCGFPPSVLTSEGEKSLGGAAVRSADMAYVLERASRCSIHAVQNELRRGFVTGQMGIRIGVCCTSSGEQLRDFSSLAIRIPHHIPGVGSGAIEKLKPFDCSVLIVSPPGAGKTTFLRELVRSASQSGKRVCVCDERREIASVSMGCSAFDLGPCTDILSGAVKAEGVMMLLRAMNPEIIALDEISEGADMAALEQAAGCGALIYATAHGKSLEQLRKRPHYERILALGIFEKVVTVIPGKERRYLVEELC